MDTINKTVPEAFPELKHAEDPTVLPFIRERWSSRSFSEQAVAPEILKTLFEAVRWSPSSMNDQPWAFIYASAENTEKHAKLASLLFPGNFPWASQAPVLILSCAKEKIQTGQHNIHAWHDLGGAHMAFSIQATALNLTLHQMGGFDTHKAAEIFEIPEPWKPVVMIALGYRSEPEKLEEPYFTREIASRKRKELDEFVFDGEWGISSKFR